MQTITKGLFLTLALWLATGISMAGNKDDSGYKFELIKEIPHTSVKNQYRSGTCWSFAGMSFFEAEMLRMGKPEVDLSEMYPVSIAATATRPSNMSECWGNTNFWLRGCPL